MSRLFQNYFLLEKTALFRRRPTPHLVCTDCRTNLFIHSPQPNCPLCLRQIYTISLSFYYRCFSCNQLKKCITSSTHPHIKCHQNLGHFVCNPSAQDKNKCPICQKRKIPTTFGRRVLGKCTLFMSHSLFFSPLSSPFLLASS